MNPDPSNMPSQIEVEELEKFISDKEKLSKAIKKAGLKLVHSKGEYVNDFLDRIIMKSLRFR
jgi:hypothetical protein